MIQDEVKSLVSQYLRKVSRSGPDNIMAVCPFHVKTDGSEEKHPSFSMSLTKGVYHCFSCHTSGNLYTFLRDMGLPRTVIHNHYGLLIDELSRSHAPRQQIRVLGEIIEDEPLQESVLGFFDYCPLALVDPAYAEPGDPVYDEELLQKLDIGFDPKHNRITFPLRDSGGKLMGISGRTVVGEHPRYKIYKEEYKDFGLPERGLTRRSGLLWNAHRVFPSVYFGNQERVILVEGFKACLSLMTAGYNNTVALVGSHLTDAHQTILERMGGVVYIMLDNDDAGRNGLLGCIDERTGKKRLGCAEKLSKSLKVKVVEYEGKQPSCLTSDQIREAVESALNYYEWAIKKQKEKV